MFQVGDKVFYPMHGAGIIKAIEEKDFRGKAEKYCLINIPSSKMDVMLPLNKATKAGLRSVVDRQEARKYLEHFYDSDSGCSLPWKKRFSSNTEKIRSGELDAELEVVSDLMNRNKEKPLNASERQMLNNAKRLVLSELALIKDISIERAEDLLELPS